MNEKIAIVLEVPSINISCDYLIPSQMKVSKVIELIEKTLTDEYACVRQKETGYMLLRMSSGKLLNTDLSAEEQGIVNGEHLLII